MSQNPFNISQYDASADSHTLSDTYTLLPTATYTGLAGNSWVIIYAGKHKRRKDILGVIRKNVHSASRILHWLLKNT